jgi:hypothetical protein
MRLLPRSLAVVVLVLFLGPISMRADSSYVADVWINYSTPYWVNSDLVGFLSVCSPQIGQEVCAQELIDVPNGTTLNNTLTPTITEWWPGSNWQIGLWIAQPGESNIPVGVAFGQVEPPVDPPNAATIQTLYYGEGGGSYGSPVYSGCITPPCSLVPGSALYWTLYGYDQPTEVGTISVFAISPEPSAVLLLATGLLAMALVMRKRIAGGIG